MTNTHGSNRVLVDSDALIGLIHKDDSLHDRCIKISNYLIQNLFTTIAPYPIILEAATTLAKDKTIKRPDLAVQLLKDYSDIDSEDESLNTQVAEVMANLYHPNTSRRNSPFDYYILALAKKNNIKYVFSFDAFYKKNGLTLIEEVLRQE